MRIIRLQAEFRHDPVSFTTVGYPVVVKSQLSLRVAIFLEIPPRNHFSGHSVDTRHAHKQTATHPIDGSPGYALLPTAKEYSAHIPSSAFFSSAQTIGLGPALDAADPQRPVHLPLLRWVTSQPLEPKGDPAPPGSISNQIGYSSVRHYLQPRSRTRLRQFHQLLPWHGLFR